MSEQSRVTAGVVMGAIVGGAAAYLFFTDRGRALRGRIEPAIDDLRREFARFRTTIEKAGDLANDGMRMVEEFKMARAQSYHHDSGTSH